MCIQRVRISSTNLCLCSLLSLGFIHTGRSKGEYWGMNIFYVFLSIFCFVSIINEPGSCTHFAHGIISKHLGLTTIFDIVECAASPELKQFWPKPALKSFLNHLIITIEKKSCSRDRRKKDDGCWLLLIIRRVLLYCKVHGKEKGGERIFCVCMCSHIFCTELCFHCLSVVYVKCKHWAVAWYVRWGFESRVWFKVFICITRALILVGCKNFSPFLPSSLLILQIIYWKYLSYFTPEKETQRKTYVLAIFFICLFV